MRGLKALALAVAVWPGAVIAGISVVDASGASVQLAVAARRIVSLAPHATELLFAAGAGERVVGAIAPLDWPPEAQRLTRVGDARSLDLERIIALKPDLAVAWPYGAPSQVERLRRLGIAVYLTDPHTPQAIADDLVRRGALSGSGATAARAAATFRARLASLGARERDATKIRVFYEIWNQPLYTVGGAHLISAAIALCGGENVFASLSLPAPSVSIESVLAAAPDAIVAGTDDALRPPWLDDWRRWKELPAVRRDNLFVVDANLLHRAGPRFADGAAQLCAALDRARMPARR